MRTGIAALALLGLVLTGCSTAIKGHGSATVDVATAKVTATRTVPLDGQGEIAPDGSRFLDLADGKQCVSSLAGGAPVCVPSGKVSPDWTHAAWSPDGTKIALTDSYFQLFAEPDVWVFDVLKGTVTDLTDDRTSGPKSPSAQLDLYPSWSADGATIRFARQHPGAQRIEVDSVPVNGGAVRTLATIPGDIQDLGALSFSDDAAVAWTIGSDPTQTHTSVYQAGSDGSNAHLVSSAANDQSLLSFSPDGQYLLIDDARFYETFGGPAKSSDASVYAVSGGTRQPVSSTPKSYFAGWSPVGHSLAIVTGQLNQLALVAAPGGAPRVIANATEMAPPSPQPRLSWTRGGIFVYADDKATLYQLD